MLYIVTIAREFAIKYINIDNTYMYVCIVYICESVKIQKHVYKTHIEDIQHIAIWKYEKHSRNFVNICCKLAGRVPYSKAIFNYR